MKFALFRKILKYFGCSSEDIISPHSHRLGSVEGDIEQTGGCKVWVSAYEGIGEKSDRGEEEVELQFRLSKVSANQAQEL